MTALCTLQVFPKDKRGKNSWSFVHDREHAVLIRNMPQPTVYGRATFPLDPVPVPSPAGSKNWMLTHQLLHDDASNGYAVRPSFILLDEVARDSPWWQFANYRDHEELSQAAFLTTLA